MAKQINIGLDLGSYSLKVIELLKQGDKYKLLNCSSVATPPGGLFSDSSVEQEAVGQAIKKLFKDAKVSSYEVGVALPESQVFTFIIETPPLSEKELMSSIQWEAEQYIPMPLDEVVLDWKILVQGKKETDKNQVLLVGVPKRIVDQYQKLLDIANITPLFMETEMISASRALASSVPQLTNIMVMNMGAGTTDFSIIVNGIFLFTRSIGTGGIALTRAIKQNLQLEEGQAEEYKKTYGFDESKLDGKIAGILKPLMSSILEEMKKGIRFYSDKYPNNKIEVLLLSGGTSLLPGLVSFLAQELGIETQIGNPFTNVEIEKTTNLHIASAESSIYTVATGLAMRQI